MYAILEMQTNNKQTIVNTPITRATRDEAESVFHQTAMYAAISSVEVHTVVIINSEGTVVKKETYKHPVAVVEPETEEGNGEE